MLETTTNKNSSALWSLSWALRFSILDLLSSIFLAQDSALVTIAQFRGSPVRPILSMRRVSEFPYDPVANDMLDVIGHHGVPCGDGIESEMEDTKHWKSLCFRPGWDRPSIVPLPFDDVTPGHIA